MGGEPFSGGVYRAHAQCLVAAGEKEPVHDGKAAARERTDGDRLAGERMNSFRSHPCSGRIVFLPMQVARHDPRLHISPISKRCYCHDKASTRLGSKSEVPGN